MQWMYFHKDIGKQINIALLAGIIFLFFYCIFDYFGDFTGFFKWISLFFVAYFFVYAILLTKKWIDKKYK